MKPKVPDSCCESRLNSPRTTHAAESKATAAGAKLILTCGPGLHAAPHGDLLVLDWDRKRIIDRLRFNHTVYPDSKKGLAGASWHGDRLFVATECELLELTTSPLSLTETVSFPFLNDVHHLAASNGNIWVCNTGLDCIETFDSQWRFIETRDLLGSPLRRLRYSYTSLYYSLKRGYEKLRWRQWKYAHLSNRPLLPNTRKLMVRNAFRGNGRELRFTLFRPHILHPNHILVLDNDIWVTLNTTGEIVSLNSGKIIAKGLGRRIHDGIVAGNKHYTTNANSNHIIVHEFNPEVPSLGRRILDKCVFPVQEGGFLRGLAVVGDRVFAGLTVRRSYQDRFKAARVVALDRQTLEPLDEWEIPKEYGFNLFSVLDATQAYG